MKNFALIFAGGVGRRMKSNSKPKQFMEINGKPIIVYTIEHFERHPDIEGIGVVIVNEWMDYMNSLVEKYSLKKVMWVIPGGNTALESQYKGLKKIQCTVRTDSDSIVLIHDGVRPLINEETISKCIRDTRVYRSSVTVAPAIETIVRTDDEQNIIETYSRSACFLARAPQVFYFDDILSIHERAQKDGKYDFVDSASMLLYYGKKIHTVMGPAENIKVTNPIDYYTCKFLIEAKENDVAL